MSPGPDNLMDGPLEWGGEYLEAPHPSFPFAGPELPHLRVLYHHRLEPRIAHIDPDGTMVLDSSNRTPTALAGWALHLPWERNPIPANGSHGHWRAKAAKVRPVREMARSLVLHRIPPQERVRIRLDWLVVTKRDRDEDNLMGTLKALTDGMRLGGVVPNDTREFVLRDMPRIDDAPLGTRKAYMRFYIAPEPRS